MCKIDTKSLLRAYSVLPCVLHISAHDVVQIHSCVDIVDEEGKSRPWIYAISNRKRNLRKPETTDDWREEKEARKTTNLFVLLVGARSLQLRQGSTMPILQHLFGIFSEL
jgi:hypothetical protein